MLFNSYFFILFFLPTLLVFYYLLNHFKKETLSKVLLIGFSLWFYAYFHIAYLFVILLSIAVNYLFSGILCKEKIPKRTRKVLLLLGLLFNIGIIFYFKYFNFFLGNVSLLIEVPIQLKNILMPLGISFFTFQQISYLVDSYRQETKGYGLTDYVLFITFFPQLVAGPIVFHDEMIPQFQEKSRKKLDTDYLARGIWLFALGLSKKVLLADTFGKGVEWGFSNIAVLSQGDAVVVMLLYTLQIYFDFSGYCDMAIGIAAMFHIDLPINFNSPYKATSITEFWDRWHITLSRFLQKYIYIPLGGSRKGLWRTIINIMLVFVISGFWHGAAWTFILWGILHGFFNVLYRLFQKIWEGFPRFLRWLLTFMFINLSWIIFRAESVRDALLIYQKIFTEGNWHLSQSLLEKFYIIEFTYLKEHISVLKNLVNRIPYLHVLVFLIFGLVIALIPKNNLEKKFSPNGKNAIYTIILLFWALISLSGITTFLYFNF